MTSTAATHRFFAALLLASSTLCAQSASATAEATVEAAIADEVSRMHFSFGADFTNAYCFRGIRQEDTGMVYQPYADLAVDISRGDSATIQAKAGMWHSFHSAGTLAASSDDFTQNWYEADWYAGFGLTTGKWSFDARHIWYSSPSGAFGTIREFDLSAAYDDSEALGAWSLKPAVTLAFEYGDFAADGGQTGTYLQLGIAPSMPLDLGFGQSATLTFPASVGLSLGDYYEAAGGLNDTFGYASIGIKLSQPLNSDSSWGAWTLSAGVQAMFMGDATSTFNSAHDFIWIGTIGLSASF